MTAVSLTILAAAMSMACGGGGGGGNAPPPMVGFAASFTPSEPNPPSSSITMASGGSSGSMFRIDIMVKDINNFFGAAFPVTFDTATATFVSLDSSGSFIDQGGAVLDFRAIPSSTDPGTLLVTATRQGAGLSGVSAFGSRKLITLVFDARSATVGNTFRFDPTVAERKATTCVVGQMCVEVTEPPLTWHGGTMTAN